MEWRSNLRRTQSLSVALSCDQPVWMEAERRDKTTVSHLIARYQSTSGGNTPNQETVRNSEPKPKQVLKQIMTSLSESNESHQEALIWRNEENSEKERSRAKTTLVRSKSMGSLQTSAGSIQVLKALFESKADTQTKADSDLRPVNVLSSYKEADIVNEDDEVMKIFAGKPKLQIPVKTVVNGEKDDHPARKVVKQTRVERRKTVGGIDFETIAASQADEKRRSIADFRDSSFIQTKEKLCVSVKAISALYLSKVQPQGSNHSPQKLVQDHSSESGKGVKLIKMAEDSRQRKVNLLLHASPGHQTGPEGTSEESFQQSMPSQLSKEKLHQQRQKCELRRLLRHTHPELKELDDVVDEELAEVLSSEPGATTGETGYEGEVLSRRLIFENCVKVSPFTAKRHMTLGTVGRGNISTTSVVSEEHEKKPKSESESVNVIMEGEEILTSEEVPNTECEEEMRRIDVQATRRMFEKQSVNTRKHHPKDKLQNATLPGVGSGTIQNKKQENLLSENISNARTRSHDVTDLPREHQPSVNVLHEFSGREELFSGETDYKDGATIPPDPENSGEIIQTRVTLFHNNPFITTNIEREHSSEQTSKPHSPANNGGEAEDSLKTNVKSRTHLFESMPFDRIRHQNQDDIETMVENMRETLHVLYKVDAIRSGGSIIEVNETMNAKKAMFTVSEGGPEIKYDEVAEGGARNFILHLLPRTNLKPQITYLKEDNKGGTQATVVNVPVHQHLFGTNQDTEFKTANVTQVVEDILNQDNSLRKGVIIQEGLDHRAEVIVYSLYYYFDEEDVKSYFPPREAVYNEPEPETVEVCKTDIQQLIKGSVESTINCLLETSKDQTSQGLIRPEITEKGNVKLFKSCIEKGDLEYLKYLQAEPAVQEELPTNRDVAGRGTELHREQKGDHAEESEWVPVDVKKLKNMFSGDQRPPQPKQNACTRFVQSTTISPAHGKSQSSTECNAGVFSDKQPTEPLWECDTQRLKVSCNFTVVPQGSGQHLETQGDDGPHKAELVELVDDKIANLQTAIHDLQQATIEAESLLHLSREKLSCINLRVEAELHPENEVRIDDPVMKPRWDECPSASNITSEHKSDSKMENGNTCHKDTNSEDTQTNEACSKMYQTSTKEAQDSFMRNADNSETIPAQQEGQEVIFQGKLQAALNSLEKSNLNVTRGDFREAMIYRQSPRSGEERSKNANASLQKHTEEGLCPLTELESNQEKLRQEVFEAGVDPLKQTEISNKEVTCALLEDRRPVRSKPAIPPKPEHLKLKHVQSTTAKNLEVTQIDTVTLGEQTPPTLAMTSSSLKDEHEPHVLKIHSKANSVPDSVDLQRQQIFNEALGRPHSDATKNIPNCHTQRNIAADKRSPQKSMTHKDERLAGAQEQCQKCSIKNTPVKPKRSKMSQPDNKKPKEISGEKNSSILPDVFEEPQQSLAGPSCQKQNISKVEMRDKKGRIETESERRQRLSVHMDEIMKGNMTTAMEIFDNFRKQEELQSLLSKVEEIEQATSEVDVRSLRGVFEDAPDWVVNSDKKKQKRVKEEDKEEKAPLARSNTELKASKVFGDLERACEEITSLKEQTLDRLMDIEGAINKALYSVSTLKSDSDINGLSCLFRESLGTVQGSSPSGSISKISIGSSRTKPAPSEESPNSVLPTSQNVSSEEASAKQRASPPSSPTFISIQTAARSTEKTKAPPPETKLCPTCQNSSKTEETFRTTKTLTCKTPAENKKRDPRLGCPKQSSHNQPDPKRGLSVLKVPTEGNAILAAKTVKENYEKTDNFGNRFFSSKKSTVRTDQPETTTSTD